MHDPMPLIRHVLLFLPLAVVIALVYNALRRENLGEVVMVSLRRLLFWLPAAAVFGFLTYEFARWL